MRQCTSPARESAEAPVARGIMCRAASAFAVKRLVESAAGQKLITVTDEFAPAPMEMRQ